MGAGSGVAGAALGGARRRLAQHVGALEQGVSQFGRAHAWFASISPALSKMFGFWPQLKVVSRVVWVGFLLALFVASVKSCWGLR